MSFIDYKGTADWLLCSILKWIADRLILCPKDRSNETSRILANTKVHFNLPKTYRLFLYRCIEFKSEYVSCFGLCCTHDIWPNQLPLVIWAFIESFFRY